MEEKYIELLLNKCIKKNTKSLFISYNKEISDFIKLLKEKAKSKGIEDIYEEIEDSYELHDILLNIDIKDMDNHKYFDKSIWDEYAKKDASFLLVETEMPGLMDDIDEEKLSKMSIIHAKTKPLYKKLQNRCKLSWNICAYPSKKWADAIYPNDNNSLEKLKNDIFKMCMIDTDNPILSWEEQITKNNKIIEYLNKLKINKLHYKNNQGTDLTVYLPEDYMFESALDNNILVNMPSYEIFTTPIYNKTEGIVKSSMPLIHNGVVIDEFYLEFKNGKVIDFNAKRGSDALKGIINGDNNSCYLGECALVEVDSKISKMNTIYKTTLIDENASCHLALGAGFPECIKNGIDMEKEELLEKGINDSKVHVDFMIGTNDLNITATTIDNKEIPIFENGKFSKYILNNIDS